MRWLVTGARGMLGTDVVTSLGERGHEVLALGSDELDVRDERAVGRAVSGVDVVVNCAAWTAVDDAEAHEREAFAVNATGAKHLARAASRAGARAVQISTDYVFAGDARDPSAEDARPGPARGDAARADLQP